MQDDTQGGSHSLPQDAGQAPGGDEDTSAKAKTYSQDEVNKMLRDEKAAAGRKQVDLAKQVQTLSTERATLQNELNSTRTRLDAVEATIEASEADAARDNPDMLRLYQERKTLRAKEQSLQTDRAKLDAERSQLDQERQEFQQWQHQRMIEDVSKAYGVSAETLANLGLTDREAVERVAQALKSQGTAADTDSTSSAADSGITLGGGRVLSPEELEKLDMDSYAKQWKDRQGK